MAVRKISESFINDLKKGELAGIFDYAKDDPEISIEIRNNYINLYYLGGKLLRITEDKGHYSFEFDSKYCPEEETELTKEISSWQHAGDYTRTNLNTLKSLIFNWDKKLIRKENFNMMHC